MGLVSRWFLKAPQSGISIKHVNVPEPLDQYIDPEYGACAEICAQCSEQDSYCRWRWMLDMCSSTQNRLSMIDISTG
jgi:hypothetical protein